jgi:tetratricopeptide (TPR) repeat protein
LKSLLEDNITHSFVARMQTPDTISNIFTIEDHNEAYDIWRNFRLKNKILVHIDAHIDFAYFPENNPLRLLDSKSLQELKSLIKNEKIWNPSPDPKDTMPDIGDYIYPAIKEGIIGEFYWVVPDDFLDTNKKLAYWKKRLARIIKKIPGHRALFIIRKGCIFTKFYNCNVIICNLAGLPQISDEVILDIDTDFFITDFKSEKNVALAQMRKRLPWIWPKGLVEALKDKGIKAEAVTIAYSVERYFTPLEFKYLGDNLKILLNGNHFDADTMKAMECRDAAMVHKYRGDIIKAAEYLNEAISLKPEEASNYYNLSLIQYKLGLFPAAKESFQKAIFLDKSYRTRYNNLGRLYGQFGLDGQTQEEYKKLLTLDPQNSYAHNNLGESFLSKGKFREAEKEFEQALSSEPKNHRAKCLLAELFLQEGKSCEAIRKLKDIIDECPGYLQAYLSLADIYFKENKVDEAIASYKSALRLGFCDTLLYMRLSILFLKKKALPKALMLFIKAISTYPFEVIVGLKKRLDRLRLLRMISS